jgi:hypothetical protein
VGYLRGGPLAKGKLCSGATFSLLRVNYMPNNRQERRRFDLSCLVLRSNRDSGFSIWTYDLADLFLSSKKIPATCT